MILNTYHNGQILLL